VLWRSVFAHCIVSLFSFDGFRIHMTEGGKLQYQWDRYHNWYAIS
jgi:hypothetical protein